MHSSSSKHGYATVPHLHSLQLEVLLVQLHTTSADNATATATTSGNSLNHAHLHSLQLEVLLVQLLMNAGNSECWC
jgi:hypothetical protein